MRRRLLGLLLGLLAGLLAALMTPLAQSFAAERSLGLHVTRLNDTTRFAVLAEAAIRTGRFQRLSAEVARYDEIYGVEVYVFDSDGRIVARSRAGTAASEADTRGVGVPETEVPETEVPEAEVPGAEVREAVATALAGRGADRPRTAWPWNRHPYVIAEPVGRDSQVLGAVVTVTPTDRVREVIVWRLVLLAALGLAVLALVTLVIALPLVRWVLRPVHTLERAVHRIAQGDMAARVSQREGPPELRGLASSFNTMAGNVAVAFGQQRSFVADASHQLRNPLGALRLRVENLADHVDDAGREEWQLAVEESERLSGLLDALLRSAWADATRAERIRVDIGEIVRERVRALTSQMAGTVRVVIDDTGGNDDTGENGGARKNDNAPENDGGWDMEGPGGDQPRAMVVVPPDFVEQTLDALLDNAVKFGEGQDVSVCVRREADSVAVHVVDRGRGLDEAELRRATERFWRSPRHQNIPGTGLGLAIAHTLAAGCGGELKLAGAHPHGLAATLVLPLNNVSPVKNVLPTENVPWGKKVPPASMLPLVKDGDSPASGEPDATEPPRGSTGPHPDADRAASSRSPSVG